MITIVSGGSRSGKSAFTEKMLEKYDDVCYIATAEVSDREMRARVKRHRERRNKNWRTFEGYKNLIDAIGEEKYYVLDCMTLLISRYMYEMSMGKELNPELVYEIENVIYEDLSKFINKLKEQDKTIYLVTNEVGYSPVPIDAISRAFRDIQGRINEKIANLCDHAYLVVMGMELQLK